MGNITENLIVVKQLPIIEEQLKTIKVNIEEKVADALSYECTEETVKAIKVLRADLTKDYKELEKRRKLVKSKVLSPYEEFEKTYKNCITEIFNNADNELKKRIDSVENNLKDKKRKEIEDYFNEYAKNLNIDFVGFYDVHINVTLSASKKSLCEQAKSFLDKICDDLKLIDTQDHKEEILVEYKNTLNVSNAITSVSERHKAIDAEKAKFEQTEQIKQEQAAVLKKVNESKEETLYVDVEPLNPPKEVKEKTLRMTFTVEGTLAQLRALKEFMNNGGYKYE